MVLSCLGSADSFREWTDAKIEAVAWLCGLCFWGGSPGMHWRTLSPSCLSPWSKKAHLPFSWIASSKSTMNVSQSYLMNSDSWPSPTAASNYRECLTGGWISRLKVGADEANKRASLELPSVVGSCEGLPGSIVNSWASCAWFTGTSTPPAEWSLHLSKCSTCDEISEM